MDRGRRRARCSHTPSPPRRRPSPAAPQPPPSGPFERRCGVASIRPAAQASIAVSASHRTKHTHSISRTNACTLSCALRAHTRAYTHTHDPIRPRTNKHTMHTCTRTLSDTLCTHIHRYTNLCLHRHTHSMPMTAPEFAHVTTHSRSPCTYNAAACAHARISWRGPRRHTPSLSLPSPARPARDTRSLKPREPP